MSRPPRLPTKRPDSSDPGVIGAQFRALLAQSEGLAVKAARLLWEARALFDQTEEWVDWCNDTAMIGRRQAFRYQKAAQYHMELESAGLLPHLPAEILSVAMLCSLSVIPPARLLGFLEPLDLRELSADDIEEMALTFTGKPRARRDFVHYRGPTPDRLIAGLDTPEAKKALNPITELDLASAHIKRAQAVQDKLDNNTRDAAARYFNEQSLFFLKEAET